MTNAEQFAAAHSRALALLAKVRTPDIDAASPKADEFIDVRDYLKDVAAIVDQLILDVAKVARSNVCCHGIDIELAKGNLIGALDGNLFYDLEQEAIGVRSAYNACHGPSRQDSRNEHRIGAHEAGIRRAA